MCKLGADYKVGRRGMDLARGRPEDTGVHKYTNKHKSKLVGKMHGQIRIQIAYIRVGV